MKLIAAEEKELLEAGLVLSEIQSVNRVLEKREQPPATGERPCTPVVSTGKKHAKSLA